jgi:hypothetical protein
MYVCHCKCFLLFFLISFFQLRTDIEEICKLIETTSRTRVKDLLGLDKRKLETELIQKEDRLKKIKENESNATGDNTTKTSRSGPYAVTITTYGELTGK